MRRRETAVKSEVKAVGRCRAVTGLNPNGWVVVGSWCIRALQVFMRAALFFRLSVMMVMS